LAASPLTCDFSGGIRKAKKKSAPRGAQFRIYRPWAKIISLRGVGSTCFVVYLKGIQLHYYQKKFPSKNTEKIGDQ
jgi:hypothetical protein